MRNEIARAGLAVASIAKSPAADGHLQTFGAAEAPAEENRPSVRVHRFQFQTAGATAENKDRSTLVAVGRRRWEADHFGRESRTERLSVRASSYRRPSPFCPPIPAGNSCSGSLCHSPTKRGSRVATVAEGRTVRSTAMRGDSPGV